MSWLSNGWKLSLQLGLQLLLVFFFASGYTNNQTQKTGHGVPQELVEEAYQTGRKFFGQTPEEKLKCCINTAYGLGGYVPQGKERVTATQSSPDGKPIEEKVMRPPDAVESLLVHHRESDVIPSYPANYKETMYNYWDAMIGLLRRLMSLTAISLGLPSNQFDADFEEPECVLRLAYYPAEDGCSPEGQMRYGEHTDYTGFTILHQDPMGSGLQVKFPDGSWRDCPPVPGGFIINAGDLIQVWTNDVFLSNIHRVAKIHPESSCMSVVFFTGPSAQTKIECLPGCSSQENPSKYSPVLSGQHLKNKLKASNI